MSHLSFSILTFFINIFPIKIDRSVILFDRKLQIFKNSPKLTISGIFNELLSTQNVNVARFARNAKCDFFCDFHTPCRGAVLHLNRDIKSAFSVLFSQETSHGHLVVKNTSLEYIMI